MSYIHHHPKPEKKSPNPKPHPQATQKFQSSHRKGGTESKNKDAAGSSGAASSARRKFRGAAMCHGSVLVVGRGWSGGSWWTWKVGPLKKNSYKKGYNFTYSGAKTPVTHL